MAKILAIGIDLGCDTLKLSYAYISPKSGKVVYGKFEKSESVRHVAVPAIAYYDANEGWIFGSDVEKGGEKPFINVVKIKTLLSLLYPVKEKGKIVRKNGEEVYPNQDYFYKKHYFPKFFFPTTEKNLENFPSLISSDRAFLAKGYTPQKVCAAFFTYVSKIADNCRKNLETAEGVTFDEVRLSLVHPAQVGKLYVSELTSLVKKAFGKAPFKVMNSGRALSMFAKERGDVSDDEGILIFDMGEDTLSVLKCFLNDKGEVVVEAASDHSMPEDIGGNDVDFSIADYIENSISRRETVGSPSYGEDGHIYEEGLQAKQYLFLKEIKKAKLLLSIPSLTSVFGKGVPVSLHRDLYLQLKLTKEDLMKSVGITDGDGIAKQILDYIVKELKMDVNTDVSKVFLTGGLVETYGLLDYLRKGIRSAKRGVTVETFDDNKDDGNPMVIQTYEDSVYAPSVGAAVVALRNYDVRSGLTYSLGTWMNCSDGRKILVIFAERGTAYDETASVKFLSESFNLNGPIPDEIFSVRLSQSTINRRKYQGQVEYIVSGTKAYLHIGEKGSPQRRAAQRCFHLKNISGDNARIECFYNGRQLSKITPGISLLEGVVTTPNSSVMTPIIEKNKMKDFVTVIYKNGGRDVFVDPAKIEVKITNVNTIVGETD